MGYTAKAHLILMLLFVDVTKSFNFGHTVVKSDVLSSDSHHVIAPELFRNSSFAFATIQTSKQKGDQVGIYVTVTIADKYSTDHSKCSLKLRPDDNDSSIIVTSLKRLSEKKVVLMGLEGQNEGKRKGFLIVLNVKNCETLYLYSSFDLAENHGLVTRETSDKFEIFMNRPSARSTCADSKNRITFKSGRKEFHCFEVDFDWSEIFIGSFSFSEDVVIVRGFDATGTYKVMVYNTAVYPYRQQLWLVLPHASDKIQVVSADLTVCWILDPGTDKSIHCGLIDKAGNLRLNKTLDYKEPIKLLSAVSASESDDAEIIVLAEKISCDGEDCQNVYASKVTDQSINHRTIKLECSRLGNKRLVLDVRQIISKGIIALEYVCEIFDRFVLNSIAIDDN